MVRDGVQVYDYCGSNLSLYACMHAKRKTLHPKDSQLVRSILGIWDPTCWLAKPPKKEVAVDWNTVKTKLPVIQCPPPGMLARLKKQEARKAGKRKSKSKVSKK